MLIKKNKKIEANTSKSVMRRKKIMAAVGDDDFDMDIDEMEDTDGIMDAIDDVADDVEDIQDAVDDIKDDQVEIAINNNIADHYIAECDSCNGIFISAVVESDQDIDHVSGVCPLCGKETDQYLKWIIKDAN